MELGPAAEAKQSPEDILGIFPTTILEQLSLPALFGNDQPVEVDLGSGPGSFLVQAAERLPDRNFLGVERLLGRVRKTCRKAWQRGIRNVRVLRLEIDYTVRYLIPSNSIARFHLYFPDPWPKRRHAARRIADAEFFEALWRALIDSGDVWIKTDHQEYFEQIQKLVTHMEHQFVPMEWGEEPYPATDFEAEFVERNLTIYRLRLGKRT
jgi:tRNA (guanine-N7-)-methyltransferase